MAFDNGIFHRERWRAMCFGVFECKEYPISKICLPPLKKTKLKHTLGKYTVLSATQG